MEKKKSTVRIALIGPESTAKSTLSEALAKHYHTVWIEEYSRKYLSTIDRPYTLNDIVTIAKKQLEVENEKLSAANKFLFADTELIISKVWCEDVFKTCPDWILENILPNKYDLYLLTSPDLPWEKDSVRENPHRRTFFYDWYEKELNAIHANYRVVSGQGDARLKNAIEIIEKFIAGTKN